MPSAAPLRRDHTSCSGSDPGSSPAPARHVALRQTRPHRIPAPHVTPQPPSSASERAAELGRSPPWRAAPGPHDSFRAPAASERVSASATFRSPGIRRPGTATSAAASVRRTDSAYAIGRFCTRHPRPCLRRSSRLRADESGPRDQLVPSSCRGQRRACRRFGRIGDSFGHVGDRAPTRRAAAERMARRAAGWKLQCSSALS